MAAVVSCLFRVGMVLRFPVVRRDVVLTNLSRIANGRLLLPPKPCTPAAPVDNRRWALLLCPAHNPSSSAISQEDTHKSICFISSLLWWLRAKLLPKEDGVLFYSAKIELNDKKQNKIKRKCEKTTKDYSFLTPN